MPRPLAVAGCHTSLAAQLASVFREVSVQAMEEVSVADVAVSPLILNTRNKQTVRLHHSIYEYAILPRIQALGNHFSTGGQGFIV